MNPRDTFPAALLMRMITSLSYAVMRECLRHDWQQHGSQTAWEYFQR